MVQVTLPMKLYQAIAQGAPAHGHIEQPTHYQMWCVTANPHSLKLLNPWVAVNTTAIKQEEYSHCFLPHLLNKLQTGIDKLPTFSVNHLYQLSKPVPVIAEI